MPSKYQLLSNTYYLFLDWFSVTVLGFLFWFILWKSMPLSEFGILNTSVNLAFFISGICIFGFNIALQKLIPEFLKRKQNAKVENIIKFSVKFVFVTSLISMF